MPWSEVPDAVVAHIEARAGSSVESAVGSPLGFSPGFAGVVSFADGASLFLKVMSGVRDPWSIDLNRREAEVLATLPQDASAPALLWTLDHDDWFVFATEAIDGEHPRPADDPSHASAMWGAFSELAELAAPATLRPFHEYLADVFNRWQTLAHASDRAARIATLGEDADWVETHLETLVAWERHGIDVSRGDALVHGDMRADNVLLTADGVVIVDWPHASRGAAWLDLVGYLPSHEMYGGGSAHDAFRAHPLSRDVTVEAERAMVAALAGFFTVQSTEPPVPALAGLREFQRAQAIPALRWLREVAGAA